MVSKLTRCVLESENGKTGISKESQESYPLGRLAKVDEYKGTLIYMLVMHLHTNNSVLTIDGGRTAW